MVILVAVMIFLATVFMWPDSIYRMRRSGCCKENDRIYVRDATTNIVI